MLKIQSGKSNCSMNETIDSYSVGRFEVWASEKIALRKFKDWR